MRITGGKACGLKLSGPKIKQSKIIRPTSDRVREALFSILSDRLTDSSILDLYAGTGALGLDSLSRGAARAVFVDHSITALELIKKNLRHCFSNIDAIILRLQADSLSGLKKLPLKVSPYLPFDIIFLDPPYEKDMAQKTLLILEKIQLLAPSGCIVIEERAQVALPPQTDCFSLITEKKYGETGIWIYEYKTDIVLKHKNQKKCES